MRHHKNPLYRISARFGLIITICFFIQIQLSIASQTVINDTITSHVCMVTDTILVQSNVYISNHASVTIEPGTVVLFQGHYSIVVKGTIFAHGTPEKKILFTPEDTQTGWNGIRYINTPSDNDTSLFINCTFEYGKTKKNATKHFKYGGALYIWEFPKVIIDSCAFRYNKAKSGAALYFNGISITVSHSKFLYNRSYSGGGGAINGHNQTLYLNNCVISHNTNGGGVVLLYGKAYLNNNIITHNTKNHNGAGVDLKYLDATLTNNYIAYNTAQGHVGGGIYHSGNKGVFNNNIIIYNNCGKDYTHGGGGIYTRSNNAIIKNNLIYKNNSSGYGGGIYVRCENGLICNNLIHDNYTDKRGGGLVLEGYNNYYVTTNNNTIVNNYANKYGGGIYIYECDVNLNNNILSKNNAPSGKQIAIDHEYDDSEVYINHCLLEGDSSHIYTPSDTLIKTYTHTIDTTPGFAIPGVSYRLTEHSPCINAGTPDTSGLNLPGHDLAGKSRITDDTVDIGAYEYHLPTGTPTCAHPITHIDTTEDFGTYTIILDSVFAYPDGVEYLGYTLTAGTDTTTTRAAIHTDTLQLISRTNRFGTDTIVLTAYDGFGGTAYDTFTITVEHVNDPVIITSEPDSITYTEHTRVNRLLDTITIHDADTGQTHTWHSDTVTHHSILQIDEHSGIVSLIDSIPPNYEDIQRVMLTAVVTDNGIPPCSDTTTFVLNIRDTNEAPVWTYIPDTIRVPEHPDNGTLLDTLRATDTVNPEESITYTITSERPDAFYLRQRDTYIVTKDSTAIDYETDSTITITAKATDNGTPPAHCTRTIIIKLTDIEEVGIAPHSSPHPITIFPNPAHDIITVQLGRPLEIPAHISIKNTTGITYQKKHPITGTSTSIDVSELPAGTYILTVHSGKYNVKRVVVVE